MYGPVTLCGRTFQNVPLTTFLATTRSYNPARAGRRRRFGLVPVRSPLLGESLLFSFPAGTKMFQFPAYAPRARRGDRPSACRVVPFGDPRITGHVHLPAAYRSLSRPSSLVRAKASTVRPNLLSLAPAAHSRRTNILSAVHGTQALTRRVPQMSRLPRLLVSQYAKDRLKNIED